MEMPPLGLKPKPIHQAQRFHDVCAAITRYYQAGLKIPIEWIEEYNDLVEIIPYTQYASDVYDSCR